LFDLTHSTTKDLQDVGVLFLRRQCSLGVLRVNFDRAATKLRWASPGVVEILRGYIDEMDEIGRRPAKEQFVAMSALLGRFDRWIQDGARPPAPPPPVVVAAEPVPEVPVLEEPVLEVVALPVVLPEVPPPPPEPDEAPRTL
jgi:hypothetical protein